LLLIKQCIIISFARIIYTTPKNIV